MDFFPLWFLFAIVAMNILLVIEDFVRVISYSIFIGPESDHWQCLSLTDLLTHSLTDSRLVNLIDVTMACEYGNSKLVEVVTVVDVDDEDRVGNSLFQIWKLRFGQKAKLLFSFEHKV